MAWLCRYIIIIKFCSGRVMPEVMPEVRLRRTPLAHISAYGGLARQTGVEKLQRRCLSPGSAGLKPCATQDGDRNLKFKLGRV